MGTALEGLIFKGWAWAPQGFQQSYPQKIWTTFKALKNQALTANFEKINNL
jgi:hypothetical protein